MFLLENGPLNIIKIQNEWYEYAKAKNCGALISFIGIVRAEDDIEALSFDIKASMIKAWFDEWQGGFKEEELKLFFAHSIGDVKIHESSFIAGVLSKQRKLGLKIINDFVEDFKARAPIWKYDVKNAKRYYAKNRSLALKGAGLLGE